MKHETVAIGSFIVSLQPVPQAQVKPGMKNYLYIFLKFH